MRNLGLREQDEHRRKSTEMKFMRRMANTHGNITKRMKILYQILKVTQFETTKYYIIICTPIEQRQTATICCQMTTAWEKRQWQYT